MALSYPTKFLLLLANLLLIRKRISCRTLNQLRRLSKLHYVAHYLPSVCGKCWWCSCSECRSLIQMREERSSSLLAVVSGSLGRLLRLEPPGVGDRGAPESTRTTSSETDVRIGIQGREWNCSTPVFRTIAGDRPAFCWTHVRNFQKNNVPAHAHAHAHAHASQCASPHRHLPVCALSFRYFNCRTDERWAYKDTYHSGYRFSNKVQ